MIIGKGVLEYKPEVCKVGVLDQPVENQRRLVPRGYYVPNTEARYWESVTQVDGVLFSHEIRPHTQRGGERSLLLLPYKNQACYALGPLMTGQTVSGWRKPEITPDFFVLADNLTPYPIEDTAASDVLQQSRLEHPLVVHNVAVDMAYDDPSAYSYELCP